MSFLNNHKEASSLERKLYTGVCTVDVIAINPTRQELAKLYNKEDVVEPNYITVHEDGYKKLRLDVFVKNDEINLSSKFTIWLEDRDNVSLSGKFQFINEKGQNIYADSIEAIVANPNLLWFDVKTARKAKVGEVDLYEFLIKFTNASTDDDAKLHLENFANMFNGDLSEIQMIKEKLGKSIKVLLGVKDEQYQDIYTKFIQRGHMSGTKTMEKNASAEYGGFKADYQNSMDLQVYTQRSMPTEEVVTYSESNPQSVVPGNSMF